MPKKQGLIRSFRGTNGGRSTLLSHLGFRMQSRTRNEGAFHIVVIAGSLGQAHPPPLLRNGGAVIPRNNNCIQSSELIIGFAWDVDGLDPAPACSVLSIAVVMTVDVGQKSIAGAHRSTEKPVSTRKGFSVGPAHLPDGTYKRKGALRGRGSR